MQAPAHGRSVVAIEVLLGAGTLLLAGVVFAVWLGMSSMRLDHEREEHAGKTE